LLDVTVERCRDTNIKTALDECQAQGFRRHFGQLHADAAQDALAGLKDDSARLGLLLERSPLRAEPARIGAIDLRIELKRTIARRPAIAVQATRGFGRRLAASISGADIAWRNHAGQICAFQKRFYLILVEPTHDAGKRFVRPTNAFCDEELVNAAAGHLTFIHRAHELLYRLNRGSRSEHTRRGRLTRVGIGFNQSAGALDAGNVPVFGWPGGQQDGIESTTQAFDGHVTPQFDTEFELNSQAFQLGDFGVENFRGQNLFIRSATQGATGLGISIHDRDQVPFVRQEICRAQTGRPRADDNHTFAGGRVGRPEIARGGFQVVIRDEPFHLADRRWIIPRPATATLLARMMAQSAEHSRQRQRLADGLNRIVKPSCFDVPKHHRHVQFERTKPVARRKAIADVIAEQQLQRRAPCFMDFLGLAVDHHAVGRFDSAGWDEFAIDLDEAHEAGGQRSALLQITKCRNIEAELARGIEHRSTFGYFHFASVNGDGDVGHSGSIPSPVLRRRKGGHRCRIRGCFISLRSHHADTPAGRYRTACRDPG
jgi:hypothetical protein